MLEVVLAPIGVIAIVYFICCFCEGRAIGFD